VEIAAVLVVAVFVFAHALISRRIESSPISGPMVFVAAGVLLGSIGALDEGVTTDSVVRVAAEVTLILLLFTDAIRIDLDVLRRQVALPGRLLGLGLPLTVVLGAGLAVLLFPTFSLVEAALLGAVLAPTDAALGRAVVSNKRVPVRIRQAINVESGLNDGLAVPVVTLFLSLSATSVEVGGDPFGLVFAARQIGFGLLAGLAAGYIGGRLLGRFARRGWVEGAFRQLGTLAIGVAAFASAELIGGNGFVAAFVAGLTFGAVAREHCEGAYDFAEDEGVLLSLITFLFFGAGLVVSEVSELDWRVVLYAVASLTVVRMVPVWLALSRAHLASPTKAYLGWFGPRGVASILFGLVVAEDLDTPAADRILSVVVWTVVLSVVLHGATASWLSDRYADWFERHRHIPMNESEPVDEMPTR
jgi:NhaP-type Na+/H+ or K+/H+ antiporter